MLTYILAGIVSAVIIAADQLAKHAVVAAFALGESKPFIPKILNLYFIENNGGAWGILGGYTWVLLAFTAVVMIICVTLLVCKNAKNPYMFWAGCLVVSGGIGNMIDRITRSGKVVDFLQFDFWRNFPVFNIADCAIVLGAGILIVYFAVDAVLDIRARKEANANNSTNLQQ